MKTLSDCNLSQVGLLASANLGLSAIAGWVAQFQAAIQTAVGIGQLAVAVVTVIYIIKKIRNQKRNG